MSDFSGQSTGRYHIIEQLGQGGMAVVYRAYDTTLDCNVAIKFIRMEKLTPENSEKTRARFKIEAKKTAKLLHPNIVPVTDYGIHEGVPYLVMRYIPGGRTLKSLLGKPIPYFEAIKLIIPIAQALAVAHANHIIHRDVKPSNILLTAENIPMLSDFGIAKVLETEEDTQDGLTATGMVIGTPEYMAPEQWEGKPVDGRADIYALGVVLYEMITGRPPFKADTVPATMVQVLRDPLPRPKQFVANLPDQIEQILYKALTKNPENRFQEMTDFVVSLSTLPTEMSENGNIKRKQLLVWNGGIILAGIIFGIILLSSNKSIIPALRTETGLKDKFDATSTMTNAFPVITTTIVATETQSLGVGSSMTSPRDGMALMYIPVGTFSMGLTDSEVNTLMNYCSECTLGDFVASRPAHPVQLTKSYWIYKTEVSNAEYQICVNSGTCSLPSKFSSETRDSYFYNEIYANYPVVWVNWDQANTYCKWAGGRLPTEAEWERAARGDDGRLYPWGNEPPNTNLANINKTFGDTTAVDAFQDGASPYGVLNMSGNVWEWVADWYQPDAFDSNLMINPQGPASGLKNSRVGRGGSFWINPGYSTTVTRDWYESDAKGSAVGFRCVVDSNL